MKKLSRFGNNIVDISKLLKYSIIFLILIAAFAPVATAQYYGNLSDNYYSFYGGPDISAHVLGSGEVPRGVTTSIQLTLSNNGVVEGFEPINEVKDTNSVNEQLKLQLQKMEIENAKMITTAVGITAELVSDDPTINVKTSFQEAGSLPAGATSPLPLKYTIDVGSDAKAGDHELTLKLKYKHLRNVIYSADTIDDGDSLLGIRNLDASYWYSDVEKEIPVIVRVEKDTKFEITNVEKEALPKDYQLIKVTYKNIGEIPAKDATVRISTSTPFSTMDDQSFIGTVMPGESKVATFKLSVDSDSVVFDKMYSINSEILYEDDYGNQKISDTHKIITSIEKPERSVLFYVGIIAVILIVIIAVAYYIKKKKEGENEE